MPNSFSKYTGGIAPIQGLYEMGANIGKNYAAGINAVSENITKGVGDYYKMVGEAQYADSELDAAGQKYTALAQMLGSEPETAHLVEGVTPILETIAKGRKGSHNAKMAAVAEVGAQGKTLNETFGYMGLVQNAKLRRIYEDGLNEPAKGEQTRIMSFGANPEDTRWSPNLSYNANLANVSANYDKWVEQNADAISNNKVKVIPKDVFISDWKKRLPSVIQNHPKMSPAQKAHALDILSSNQMLEGVNIDNDPSWEGLRGQVEYTQNWDTINPYIGSGQSASSTAARAANAPDGAMATPTAPVTIGGFHPQAVKLADENEKLIAESKQLIAKIGTTWGGSGDAERKTRLKEIQKQITANTGIINSLGGGDTSANINKAEASRGKGFQVPKIVLDDPEDTTEPVIAPPKVVEAPAPAPVQRVAPAPAPVQRVAPAPAPVVTTRKAQPSVDENGILTEQGASDLLDNASKILGVPFQDLDDVYKATPEASRGMAYADWLNGIVSGKIRYKKVEKIEDQAAPTPMAPAKVVEAPSAPAPMAPAKVQATEPYAPRPLTDKELNPTVRTPNKSPAAPAEAIAKDGESTVYQFPPDTGGKYTVKKGMTLMTIAERAGTTRRAIMKANGISENHNFKGGETIIIPPSAEQNKAIDRDPQSIEPIEAQISQEEAEGGLPSEDTGITIDPATGNMVNNNPITGFIPPDKVDEPVSEEDGGLDTGAFEPIKLRPVGSTAKPPSLPAGVRAAYTPQEIEDIQLARQHLDESNAELESQNRSVKPAIEYLQRIRENVMKGDASSVDYGYFGQLQKEHPDAAAAISVGVQAASVWIGGGWAKTLKFANKLEKTNYAAKRLNKAREIATKAFDAHSKKLGRALTDSEIGKITSRAIAEAGLAGRAEAGMDVALLGKAITQSAGKSIFWESLALELAGAPNSEFSIPDDANSQFIRKELSSTLSNIRKVRTGPDGGYNPWTDYFTKPTKISAYEKGAISTELDKKIADLQEIHTSNSSQLATIKANATVDNLLQLAKDLKVDAKAKLAATKIAQDNGINTDTNNFLDEDIDVGSRPIASKEIVIPQTNEQKKTQMKEFIKGKLGHIPAGFEDMWRKQFPESTLQVKETPYGAFYTDGKGEWKQVASSGGKQLQPHEISSNKAVQFGELKPDGTYEPTEFIKGTGIKLGGLGAFGTPSDATKFRSEYHKKIKAVGIAEELRKLNDVTFRSFMPSEWGKAKAQTYSLIAQLRTELIGVGSVSDFEQKLLQDLVTNPTDFFSLQSTTRAKYEDLISRLSTSLVEDPQTYGLEVIMPKDKATDLRNMRAVYFAQQKRHEAKMAEYDKLNKK